jgi:hypothetical protein
VAAARTKQQTLAWLRTLSGELSTATLKRLEDTLPWYRDMPPGRRSAVGLVAQAGITSFISWYDDPKSIPWIAADVFGAAPRELLRSVSLQQTLLGWNGHGEVAVLVGTAPKMLDVDMLRRTARHLEADVLIGVQGSRLVIVIGRVEPLEDAAVTEARTFLEIAAELEPGFGPGHLVLGHTVPSLLEAARSAKAALAGFAVAKAWRNAPRPTLADDLLPERAFAGDPLARSTLINRIYRPLQDHSTELLTTLWCYLDNGRSLEATARELFVHPNTVRYRLKRVSEVIGYDATGAREALILQSALVIGAIAGSPKSSS